MMRDIVPPLGRSSRIVRLFRGDKQWDTSAYLSDRTGFRTAAALRRAAGTPAQQLAFAQQLYLQIEQALRSSAAGNTASRHIVEAFLLNAQRYAFQNPYISCSYSRAVALSFALAGDAPGYVYTLEGDWHDGLDFEDVRSRWNLHGDVFDYLKEFGIPLNLANFDIVRVEEVDPSGATRQVYP